MDRKVTPAADLGRSAVLRLNPRLFCIHDAGKNFPSPFIGSMLSEHVGDVGDEFANKSEGKCKHSLKEPQRHVLYYRKLATKADRLETQQNPS